MTIRLSAIAFIVVSMVALGTARPVHGAPITYAEAVSGDLGLDFPASLLTFDVGVNTVSGSVFNDFSGISDRDAFAFTIPTGAQLTNLSYSWNVGSTPVTGAANVTYIRWLLDVGNADPNGLSPLGDAILDAPLLCGAPTPFCSGYASTNPITLFPTILPLGSGTYSVLNVGIGGNWSSDYTMRFTVTSTSPVPEPSTLTLLSVGLVAGVGRLRRRA